MAIIGPRPLLVRYLARYNEEQHHRHDVRPGLVWLLKKKNDIKLPYNVKKFLLHRPSILKSYYISRAKIFTSDNEVVPKARDDQKMYYFDHGSICLKNCKPFFNMSRKKIDYFFSPSPNYDAIYCNQMSIEYPNKKMLYLGYPIVSISCFGCIFIINKVLFFFKISFISQKSFSVLINGIPYSKSSNESFLLKPPPFLSC